MFWLAAGWKSKLDWPFEVEDGAFRDPDGRRGLGRHTDEGPLVPQGTYSQTRYRFTA